MNLNKKNNILLIFFCIGLIFIIFQWIHYLTMNKYIVECFTSGIVESSSTSHSVDLPLTTKYSCKNFCGPNARCSITGQQCMADIDCPGCQPYSSSIGEKTADVQRPWRQCGSDGCGGARVARPTWPDRLQQQLVQLAAGR